MEIKPIAAILKAAGLQAPTLDALLPNDRNYTTLLFQPQGAIEGDKSGVRNRDRDRATAQFAAFLAEAEKRGADLAITPEYSLPWEVLVKSVKAGAAPPAGKLWVLGCESIKYGELTALKADLAAQAELLFEELGAPGERFLDPLAYVFAAHKAGNPSESRLVILIQFKTRPMGDAEHFENNNLQTGKTVYQLGGGNTLRLVSLICSDVFDFTDDHAKAIYDRTLIIHVQLNKSPRHESYRQYRDKLLFYATHETELICLNWAANVIEWCGAEERPWKNPSASAWYLKPEKFDIEDSTLHANHRLGLYYTYLATKRFHALFFNYQSAVFVLTASKVAHIGVPAPLSRRRGPQLAATLVWDTAAAKWTEQPSADDGFAAFAGECGDAKAEIEKLLASNTIAAERVLALCAGQVGPSDDWHKVTNLDSCMIDSSEIVRRMTFCQDPDAGAGKFRIARLKLCKRLMSILKSPGDLPVSLADFKGGFQLDWAPAVPHSNASSNGRRATVVYMGELAAMGEIEAASKRIAEFIGRSFTDDDKRLEAKQRLAVWYQDDGKICLHDAHRYVKIDEPRTGSEVDIARQD